MLFKLVILLVTLSPMGSGVLKSMTPNTVTPNRSHTASNFDAERKRLQDELDSKQSSEDRANSWNRRLTFAAVIAATLFGIGAFLAQKIAQEQSLEARPIAQQLQEVEDRERLFLEARIADASASASDSLQKAEAERLERVKLEKEIAPRRLSEEQQRLIAGSCAAIYGGVVHVISYRGDVEGAGLAKQIIAAFNAVHIRANPMVGFTSSSGEPDEGIKVWGPPSADLFVNCLTHALQNVGRLQAVANGSAVVPPSDLFNVINANFSVGPGYPGGALPEGSAVIVFVASRPLPLIGSSRRL